MPLKAKSKTFELSFRTPAGTSRGMLTKRKVHLIKLFEGNAPEVFGIGEASPLEKLSIDDRPDLSKILEFFLGNIGAAKTHEPDWVKKFIPSEFPSLRFALETAWADLQQGGQRLIFNNAFTRGQKPLTINGLIWMGEREYMLHQIEEKLSQGFHCLKMKVGAFDFETEVAILQSIRARFSATDITLRLDANGAFSTQEALPRLQRLAALDIHSIEQPIAPRQYEAMATLCEQSPIPIALDEELINLNSDTVRERVLKMLKPKYIVLKPSLIGGFSACREWIALAKVQGIEWWFTSMLESNVGLNAIAQFAAEYDSPMPQGLGTGQLFTHNFDSPLHLEGEQLHYKADKPRDALEF